MAAHDAAASFGSAPTFRFAVGVSDHALGLGLEEALRRVRASLPAGAVVEVRSGQSQLMRASFGAGALDAAVIRREGGSGDGEVLATDPLGWRAAETCVVASNAPVPLALLAPPCGVRAVAVAALERAGRPWREALVGEGCAALLAGARAGLGVAPMGRVGSGGLADRGPALGLPGLPRSEIVLLARAGTPALASAVRALAAGVRASFG